MQAFDIPHDKINVNGGAIAMGHPLGATGAMILGTVLDELERRDLNTALVTLCIGAGMGTATIIETGLSASIRPRPFVGEFAQPCRDERRQTLSKLGDQFEVRRRLATRFIFLRNARLLLPHPALSGHPPRKGQGWCQAADSTARIN